MAFLIRPCAVLMLLCAAGIACAEDTHAARRAAQDLAGPAFDHGNPAATGAGGTTDPGWQWSGLKAGLKRKLDGGWTLGLNYGRPGAAAGLDGRHGAPAPRAEERSGVPGVGHKGLVLSMGHSF